MKKIKTSILNDLEYIVRFEKKNGNSGNRLLKSRVGAAEYRLILFRHRLRAKQPAK